MYMDPPVSTKYKFEIVAHAIEVIVLKHVMATGDWGKSLQARLEELLAYRRDGT